MNPAQVVQVLGRLDGAGLTVWLDGGWGVDALLGEQTRPHEDLDLAIARHDCPPAPEALAGLGFAPLPRSSPGSRRAGCCTRLMAVGLTSTRSRSTPEAEASTRPAGPEAVAGSPDDRSAAPPRSFSSATISAIRRTGDRHDLRLLADRVGLSLPPNLSDG